MRLKESIALYIIIVNLISFLLFYIDKKSARLHGWRISEKILLLVSLLGGAAGGYAAMLIYRHKTKKIIFKYGMPILIIINISLFLYLGKTIF